MARYIDADKVIEFLSSQEGGEILKHSTLTLVKLVGAIKKIPTADVVEVVRCADCQYFSEGMAVGICYRVKDKPLIPCCFDYFCAYGQRRKK